MSLLGSGDLLVFQLLVQRPFVVSQQLDIVKLVESLATALDEAVLVEGKWAEVHEVEKVTEVVPAIECDPGEGGIAHQITLAK